MSLNNFFYPKSIAVIGASVNPYKAGYQISKNLLDKGYEGDIYLVNPNEKKLFEEKVYTSLADIEGEVELILVVVPAIHVLEVFKQAEKRGDVKSAIILASGFSETKIPERIDLEKQVLDIAHRAGIRVIGPNCVGVMNMENNLDTTFSPPFKGVGGRTSFISQSGSIGCSILMTMCDQPVSMGFNKWAHVGNMADVNVEEVLRYYKDDKETDVIAIYMEGMTKAKRFFETAKEVTPTKPILVLKVGRSEMGSVAAASHTGSLAGSDAIFEGAFKQTGILRMDTVEEAMDTAKALSMQPLPKGNRVSIITEAGGAGVICMDEIGSHKEVVMAKFSEETEEKLRKILPDMALISNPQGYVDMTAAADGPQHSEALEVILNDSNVDAVVLLSVPPNFLNPVNFAEKINEKAELARKVGKPVLICFMAGNWVKDARINLEDTGLPTFDMPQRAGRAMVNMIKRSQFLEKLNGGIK